ncbi:MAG: anion permease [Chitinispirillales bacterium]|nr:anion permease [Chitinispirillales bacterium]
MEINNGMNIKKNFFILFSVLIIIGSFFIQGTETLSSGAIRTIALAVVFLILLITEALPLTIICWSVLGIMPLINIAPGLGAALSGFSNPVVFFILASFGIAAAFTELPLSKRILVLLLRKFGKNIKSMLLAIMLCILPLTAFVSSVPICALFMGIGLRFLELFEDDAARKKTGRALMIAIPVTCLFGGVATPVGSTMNLLAIDLLETYTNKTISFIQWTSVGVPIVLLMLPVAWILICKIYKPAEINSQMIETFIEKLDVPPKMSSKEKKVLVITSLMLVLWIMSSWFSQINIVVVAILGACIMFFPGIRVLEWNSFAKSINFNSFFLVGTVLSLGKIMDINGVSKWIITFFPESQMPLPGLIAFTVALVFTILIIMPVAPSVVMLLALPLINLAQSMGYSPELIIITLAIASGNCYLLPLDTIPLITYSSGYYSMLDMPKSTFLLQIYVIIVVTSVLFIASSVFGII